MFSANENIQLRQYKKRVVGYVESTIPEEVLDMGVNVMVMQVSCKAPGCVPLETAIVIIFPPSKSELMEGLPESAGGSFKTKILMPLADVTKDDVLDALPPGFPGGRKTMERLCLQARDVMLGQITQLFGDEDVKGRNLMAQYLQQSLQDYMDSDCQPPEWGEAFDKVKESISTKEPVAANGDVHLASKFQSEGNIVLKRPVETADEAGKHQNAAGPAAIAAPSQESLTSSLSSSRPKPSVNSITRIRQQQTARRQLAAEEHSAGSLLSQLAERKHAPSIRRPGCPCCEPDNPSNVADRFLGF